MRVLQVNAADNEGGAAKAATRLLHGIHAQGVESALYVQRKFGHDPRVLGPRPGLDRLMGLARPTIEETLLGIRPSRRNGPFSAAYLPDRLRSQVASFAPDLVHLHWVARMMRIETLAALKLPIVWTMHDSWAFTGGCYLPLECTRYQQACGHCPVLCSTKEKDLSTWIWNRKRTAWHGLDLTVVAPSRWMAERAKASSLLGGARVEVIPNGIDIQRYQPIEKSHARELLSLPRDRKLILFGAKGALSDRNKGFHLLAEAVRDISGRGDSGVELAVFGASAPGQVPELGLKVHYLGWQGDDSSLALLYAAADVFVLPSISENLPYTVMEAMACGTPCVAFAQGGVPDLIDHRINGYLARPFQAQDLAQGVQWVLDKERHSDLSAQAREKVVREFSIETVAQKHASLYSQLLRSTR
ncbi:MAG TPA: glycosyltransferase family 4 protein [Geomonas sp.]|nr:glycosyltransferase family 4 protein [Geomonas sp.]